MMFYIMCTVYMSMYGYRKEEILNEYEDVVSLISYYPYHLSLWYHR